MATRREFKEAIGQRYRAAARWERRQILDEFTRVTGYHRKHALRVLLRPFLPRTARPRPRIYDEAVRQALTMLWEAGDRICGKRLKALLPVLIESMERHGNLCLDPAKRSTYSGMKMADSALLANRLNNWSAKGRPRPMKSKMRASKPSGEMLYIVSVEKRKDHSVKHPGVRD